MRNFTVVVIPENAAPSFQLTASTWFLKLSSAVLLITVLLSVILFIKYYEILKKKTQYKQAEIQSQFQQFNFKAIQNDFASQIDELEKLNHFYNKIRIITNWQGSSKVDHVFEINRLEPVDKQVHHFEPSRVMIIKKQAEAIRLNIEEQKINYLDLEYIIYENKDRLSRIPSIKPVKDGHLSSGYGVRQDPFTGLPRMHYGIDWAFYLGTPIYAPANGYVKKIEKLAGYGKLLTINHGYGLVTRYAHLETFEVKEGQTVKRGDLIARMGNTGLRSTAVHLHYETLVNGKHVNPKKYLLD